MTNTNQLIINLLPLGLKLHRIGERLPFTAAAHPEMPAERLQTILGRSHDPFHEPLVIILALFGHTDVNHIAGNGERDKDNDSVPMGERLALGGASLDSYVL